MPMVLINFISSETRTVRLTSDNLLEIVYFDHAHITVQAVMKDMAIFDEIVQRRKVRKLVVLGRFTRIDLEARKLAAEENRKRRRRIQAEAIVVRSTTVRLAINMYMIFLRNPYLVKVFSNRESALEWLNTI